MNKKDGSKLCDYLFCSNNAPEATESSKVNNLLAINEALQGKIRLLENRIARMQDELQENASMSHAENVAIMIRNQHRKTKPVIRYFF